MFVSPFWSYRRVGDASLFTNWVTKRSVIHSPHMVDYLEAVFAQEPAIDSAKQAWATDFEILFESQSHADEYFLEREERSSLKFPVIDQIELTNRCPYTCKMCPRTVQMTRALGDLPLDLFERIITQISGHQEYVALHHFGESLVYRHLPEAIRYAANASVQTGLSCNPPSLHPKLASAILEAGIANIVLSLDSLDPMTYRSIRGPAANLAIADKNIRELVRLRDSGGYPTAITLQMIGMYSNQSEAAAFLDYCAQVGVDRGVVVCLGRWDFSEDYISILGQQTSPGYDGYCTRPWQSVAVLWDGRVVPCCHDYNGVVVFGNLADDTLLALWDSEEAKNFRLNNPGYALCQQCSYSGWHRTERRIRDGFRTFHRELNTSGTRMEWLNPHSGARDGRRFFDGFHIQS